MSKVRYATFNLTDDMIPNAGLVSRRLLDLKQYNQQQLESSVFRLAIFGPAPEESYVTDMDIHVENLASTFGKELVIEMTESILGKTIIEKERVS